jgi:hypothetical protein
MFMTRFHRTIRVLIPAIAVTVLAIGFTAGRPVEAAGLRNCVDVTEHAATRVACYEDVWVAGVQLRMTFFAGQTAFTGSTPNDRLTDFFVLAPQTAAPQGTAPFAHDHVVGNAPAHNQGEYRVHLHGFFVFCSAQGIASDLCAPGSTPTPFGAPFAKTVNGQPLTSAEAIESAAAAGLITLFDTGGVLIGTIGPGQ